jgi:hypothetical protein
MNFDVFLHSLGQGLHPCTTKINQLFSLRNRQKLSFHLKFLNFAQL